MKKLALFSIILMMFSAEAVFACGGSGCDKDKDKGNQAFTVDAQYLCGGSGCRKPKPAPEPEPQCGSSCGGGKDKKPAPEPELMCGGCGSGCDKDCCKDKKETQT